MTALEYRRHVLFCNYADPHLDGTPFFRPPDGKEFQTSLTDLRKLAAKAGWTHVPHPSRRKLSQDYCPEHKPEPKP
jgi:hypothetical protein